MDAFDFHDESLATAIGTYDGHAYEQLLLAVQDSELNKADVSRIFLANLLQIFCCWNNEKNSRFSYLLNLNYNTLLSKNCHVDNGRLILISGIASIPQVH